MGAEAQSRRVAVIGGAGYVGNVLVRQLLAAGHEVVVLDRLLFGHGSVLAGLYEQPGFVFRNADLRDRDALSDSIQGATDVVLLAALVGDPISRKYPDLTREVNDVGAKQVFDVANELGVERFVFTSTCSNYGLRGSDEPATEESELAPLSLYSETKVRFEQHVLGLREHWKTCPVILRIATAYGLSPRMRFDLTISEFTKTMTMGEELLVYDADTWRPYCHVADISRAIIHVIGSPEDAVRGEIFNVGHSDENYTKRMVVDAVQDALGGRGKVRFGEGGQDARNYRVSFEKIRKELGFEPIERVPRTIERLARAIQSGVFDDANDRPGFYANQTISGVHKAHDGGD